MPSAVTAIFGGNTQPLQAAFAKMYAMAAGANANLQNNLNTAAGGARGLQRAMYELLVIFREIGRGNWARVPGSLTILMQRMGIDLVKVFMSVPGIVAAAGAAIAYFTFRHLKALNEALDKTGEMMEKAFGDRAKANFETLKQTAAAAADFEEWLRKLGHTQETLADQTEQSIAALRTQFELLKEIAGSDHAEALKQEDILRRNELDLVNENLEKQKKLAEESKTAAQATEEAAFGGKDAVLRREKLNALPRELSDMEEGITKFSAMQKELQDKVEDQIRSEMKDLELDPGAHGAELQRLSAAIRNRVMGEQFTVKGGERLSLNDVNGLLQKERDALKTSQQLDIELTATQRQLDDALKNAKAKSERDTEAVERLTKRRDELSQAISDHARLDSIVARDQEFQQSLDGKSRAQKKRMLEDEITLHEKNAEFYHSVGDKAAELSAAGEEAEAGKLRNQLSKLDAAKIREHGFSLSQAQRLGAYAATPPDMKKIADATVETAHNTRSLKRDSNRPVASRPAQYGSFAYH